MKAERRKNIRKFQEVNIKINLKIEEGKYITKDRRR